MPQEKGYPRSQDQCSRCKAHAMQDTTFMFNGVKQKARYCRRCALIATDQHAGV